jgi:hypothetical protein
MSNFADYTDDDGETVCLCDEHAEARRMDGQAVDLVDAEVKNGLCLDCETAKDDGSKPPPGSWADVARMMAAISSDDGTDWDAWKDEMKETNGQGY